MVLRLIVMCFLFLLKFPFYLPKRQSRFHVLPLTFLLSLNHIRPIWDKRWFNCGFKFYVAGRWRFWSSSWPHISVQRRPDTWVYNVTVYIHTPTLGSTHYYYSTGRCAACIDFTPIAFVLIYRDGPSQDLFPARQVRAARGIQVNALGPHPYAEGHSSKANALALTIFPLFI